MIKPQEVYFLEQQRFRQWWLWLIVLVPPISLVWPIYQQFVMNPLASNGLGSDYVLILVTFIFGLGFPVFIYNTGLDTEVRENGVCIRFRPFHRKWVVFGFDYIHAAHAITYSPLKDYGGWGIRFGRKGKAYNVSGNKGVMLSLKDGKNILIGSQNNKDLWTVINERLS